MRYVLAAALLICLVFAAAARADTVSVTHRRMIEQAQQFWAERNVRGCEQGIDAAYWEFDPGIAGQAVLGGCQVWLDTGAFTWTDAYSRRYQCAYVTHEVGHALGLEHSVGGVMDPWYAGEYPPWFCRVAYPLRALKRIRPIEL